MTSIPEIKIERMKSTHLGHSVLSIRAFLSNWRNKLLTQALSIRNYWLKKHFAIKSIIKNLSTTKLLKMMLKKIKHLQTYLLLHLNKKSQNHSWKMFPTFSLLSNLLNLDYKHCRRVLINPGKHFCYNMKNKNQIKENKWNMQWRRFSFKQEQLATIDQHIGNARL